MIIKTLIVCHDIMFVFGSHHHRLTGITPVCENVFSTDPRNTFRKVQMYLMEKWWPQLLETILQNTSYVYIYRQYDVWYSYKYRIICQIITNCLSNIINEINFGMA